MLRALRSSFLTFILKVYRMIIEEFKTHQELLDKLISQKHLIVDDLDFAEQKLKELGYFNIVGGYKEPFIDPDTKFFIKRTTFKDLYELYSFDKQLKHLFMTYLCQIERRVAVSLAYAFTELYGNAKSQYLDSNNYNNIPQNIQKINKLIRLLERAVVDDKHDYIIHQ